MENCVKKKIKQIQRHNGGGIILSGDFSTLEVRIFSAISKDPQLRDVLLSGADLHCNTARNIFPELKGLSDKEIKEHHSGLRSKAKSCFIAGTKVLLSDGTTKCIENIKVGDIVVSREEFTNKLILSRVIESKETNRVKHLVEIKLENGSSLVCTPEHKIRLRNGQYKNANLLTVYDEIDSDASIETISFINKEEPTSVYDIEVDNESNSHNFCANGVFVHNCMFGLLYGKSAFNFAKDWGVSVEEAQQVIDGMMGAYKGIKTYIEEQHKFAREHGYIEDVFGCVRPLSDAQLPDTKANRKRLAHAMNASQNSPIQCFVGDTKIKLTEDSYIEIERLVNNYSDKYVISCCKNGKKIKGKIINAVQTGKTCLLCKVRLSNNECVTCTPEHQFMLKDGSYEHAINLNTNTLLMGEIDLFVVSVEQVELKEEVPVYDIEVENEENTHNFLLSAGVFVHNSSASRMAWIGGTHVQEEFILQGLSSIMIGGVHDSTYIDVYPGELVPVLKIFQFHAETVPNKIYDWLNGNRLFLDFGLGQSWGREMDVKKWELSEGKLILNLKGGNVNWDYLKRELDDGYEYELLEMKDGDPIPPEEREDLPIEVPTQFVSVKLAFPDPCPNMEFKSKYYVGNGYYGKREED